MVKGQRDGHIVFSGEVSELAPTHLAKRTFSNVMRLVQNRFRILERLLGLQSAREFLFLWDTSKRYNNSPLPEGMSAEGGQGCVPRRCYTPLRFPSREGNANDSGEQG